MKMDETLYSVFDASEESHWWFLARREIILALLGRYLTPGRYGTASENSTASPRPRILEIGCGAGATLKELEKLGEAVGADISEEALEYCRSRGCRDVRLVKETGLPFAAGEFDVVVSLDVLEHVDDDLRAVLEYRRVLRAGGFLLITVPAYNWLWSLHDDINRHRRRYTRRSLRRVLDESQWSIFHLTYFCTYLFPLVAATRFLLKGLDRFFNWKKEGLDFKIPGQAINRACRAIFSSEAKWLKISGFPFGSSLLAICRKPE